MYALGLNNFSSHIGPVIMGRARTYWQQKRARLVSQNGSTYEYQVNGSRAYRVRLTIDDNRVTHYECDCPYGGACKHIGAALLQHTRGDADTFIERQQAAIEAKTKAKEEKRQSRTTNQLGVTDDALYLLCAIAYGYFQLSGYETIKRLDGKNFSQAAIRECLKELKKHDLVSGEITSYWYRCELNMDKYFFVMDELFARPEWQEKIKTFVTQSTHSIFLRECAEILNGRREAFTYVYSRTQFAEEKYLWMEDILVGGYKHPGYDRLLKQLHPDFQADLLNDFILYAFVKQETELFEMIGKTLDEQATLTPALKRLSIVYRKDLFYYTGEELSYRSWDNDFSAYKYIQATKALYEGRLDEAISLYQEGIKRQNKEIGRNYIPWDPISFFLYVVAMALRHTEADIQQLRSICAKEQKMNPTILQAGFSLAKFFKDSEQFIDESKLYFAAHTVSENATLDTVLSYLLLLFFQKDTSHLPRPKVKCALLQRELSAFIDTPEGNWPYQPMLNQLHIRPSWELKLQELIRDSGGSSETDSATPRKVDKRLCYMFGYYGYLEVREQSILKSGAWSKGKTVSPTRYREGGCEMDEIDQQIYNEWCRRRGSYETYPPFSLILPHLKGTDKLLRDDQSGFTVIQVAEELPYIYTEKDNEKISFQTNVPEEALKTNSSLWYSYDDDNNRITYYPIATSVKDYFLRIIRLGSVPEEAEPMLEQLFSALKGRVEIQSEIQGAVQLETIKGSASPILQIRPDGQQYLASLVVRPLEHGELIFQPGSGKEQITDKADGIRYHVQRNLKKENQLRNQLLQVLREHIALPASKRDEYVLSMHDLLIVLELLAEQPDLCSIEWPKGEKIKLRQMDAALWNISATAKGGWFELEGEIPITEKMVLTMSQLLEIMRDSDGKFIRLNTNEFITLSEQLRRQLARIDAIAQESHGHVRVPELSLAVAGDALHGELEITEPQQIQSLRQRIRESEQLSFAIPDELNATLRDYQIDGFQWLMRLNHWGAGACLADDMGLGKTVQTITCLLCHASEGAQMVVAPASVVSNWHRELARFAPSLTVFMLNEIAIEDREEFILHIGEQDVLVTTYGLLVSESETLVNKDWVTVCLDEAHTIKNRDTKASAAAMNLKAQNRIILTGTPIQNHLGELWNLMQFINPNLLGNYEHFTERFITPIAAGEQEPKQQLKRMIAPFVLRRTKQEVARELPDKIEIRVPVLLSEEEMAVYEVLRRNAKEELESSSSLSMNALAMITKLREAACSAALAEKTWTGKSSKIEAMIEKLLPMMEEKNRVLIFSQFTSFLKMAREAMEEAGLTDYFYLDGSTPIRERQRMVDAFQQGQKQIFIISLKAGGLGLNLTGANYVIHLDPWWNPAIEQQATDRAYRIGQQQKVTVYHFISEHTIEEKILRLHESKRSLADSLLEGTEMSHKLTSKDLLELLDN